MLAIATAIATLSAFGLSVPLMQAQAVTTGTPIPNPASCTYTGHPTSPLSQTTVAVGPVMLTKHAEKELYNCIISGQTTHYILDTTVYTTVTQGLLEGPNTVPVGTSFAMSFVVCAKDGATGTVYSCQTEPVGKTLSTTKACSQLTLGFPQKMDTVVVNGAARTIESQKEIFKCTTVGAQVIQEVIIWTMVADYPIGTTGGINESQYAAEICQKPVTSIAGLPTLNCQVTGPVGLVG